MKTLFRNLLPVALMALTVSAVAQNDDIYNENVIVIGNYKPVLENHQKINVAPTIVDTATKLQHSFNYKINPTRMSSFYEPSRIKAANVIGEPKTRLYNNYVRMGFGNYWTPLLDVFYNSTTSKHLNYGASVSHLSSWGTLGDKDDPVSYYGSNQNSLTSVSAFGKYIYKEKLQFSADLKYQNDYNLYYGFNDSQLDAVGLSRGDISKKDYRACYNFASLNAGVKKIAAGGWGYNAQLNVADLWSTYNRNELNLNIDGSVSHKIKLGQKLQPTAALRLQLSHFWQHFDPETMPLGYDVESGLPTAIDTARGFFVFNPNLSAAISGFQLHAGLTGAFDYFTDPRDMAFYLFPDLSVTRNFFRETLGLTLGAVGNVAPVSWNAVRLKNPYVQPDAESRLTRHYDFFAQARYSLTRKLQFNLKASYNLWYDYLSFMLSDNYMLNNVFQPKYESFNQWVFRGDVAFVNDEMIAIELGGTYYKGKGLEPDTLPGLYHPSFDAHLNIHLNYHDKILVHLQGLVLSKMNAAFSYNPEDYSYETTVTLPMRYGINLEVEYRHSKALSFFLKADNLAFQRYYYWQNYPSPKALFIGGLTYTIH